MEHLPIQSIPNGALPNGVQPVPRFQNKPTYHRSTRHTTLHLKQRVRADLERKAKEDNLSISATGAAIIEWFFQQSIYTQNAATIDAAVDKSIGKHMRAESDRQATLQVRNLVRTEEVYEIVTNILGREPGMDEKTLKSILSKAYDIARARITRITPQLKTIIEAVKKLFDVETEGGNANA